MYHAVAVLLGLAFAAPAKAMEVISRGGRYRVSLAPTTLPVPIGQLHRWQLQVERLLPGTRLPMPPLSAATRRRLAPLHLRGLTIDGGMPAHGHGLPTAPIIAPAATAGIYTVDGMRFNMAGMWLLRVLVADPDGLDLAEFPVQVGADATAQEYGPVPAFSSAQKQVLRSLSLAALGPLPPDPSNRVADAPRAIALGHRLFFDRNLSKGGAFACSTCHDPRRHFTDGLRVGRGHIDLSRNTPSLVGAAYATWQLWDGRRDSLWSQALIPLEAPDEMAHTRLGLVRYVLTQPAYRKEYIALFGSPPALAGLPEAASPVGDQAAREAWAALSSPVQLQINQAFANLGKVLAAYERRLKPGEAPFDRFVGALLGAHPEAAGRLLPGPAVAGLKIFLSADAQCLRCHNGPLLTNGGFHQIATANSPSGLPDFGRSLGIMALFATEFNCLGPYSDDRQHRCPELAALDRHQEDARLNGAYKVPSLRNVADTAPYMHDGRFQTLKEVLEHYRSPKHPTPATEIRPFFDMTATHAAALMAFLASLSAPVDAPAALLQPPAAASAH